MGMKDLTDNFLTKCPSMAKSEVKVEKCHLVAELKLKMLNTSMLKVTFQISTPPSGGTFEPLLRFSYL